MKKKVHIHKRVGSVVRMICGASGGLTDIRNTSKVTCRKCKRILKKSKMLAEVYPPDPRQMLFEL